jgi:hypothetical protein
MNFFHVLIIIVVAVFVANAWSQGAGDAVKREAKAAQGKLHGK